MSGYVLGLQEIDQTKVAVVGGKGANLGAIFRRLGSISLVNPGRDDAYRKGCAERGPDVTGS